MGSLAKSDIAAHALEHLASSSVRRVVLVGRRSPLEVSFTIKELRELSRVPGCTTRISPESFQWSQVSWRGLLVRPRCSMQDPWALPRLRGTKPRQSQCASRPSRRTCQPCPYSGGRGVCSSRAAAEAPNTTDEKPAIRSGWCFGTGFGRKGGRNLVSAPAPRVSSRLGGGGSEGSSDMSCRVISLCSAAQLICLCSHPDRPSGCCSHASNEADWGASQPFRRRG